MLRGNQITVGITATDARKLAQLLVETAEEDELSEEEQAAGFAGKIGVVSARNQRPRPAVPFTPRQGKYLAFIHHYLRQCGCSPAESDIQRHFLVSVVPENSLQS